MTNMTIGRRLGLAFCLVLGCLLSIAALGVNRLGSLNQAVSLLVHDRYPMIMQAGATLNGLKDVSVGLRNLLLIESPDQVDAELEQIRRNGAIVHTSLADFEKKVFTARGREIFVKLQGYQVQFDADQVNFLGMVAAGRKAEAAALLRGAMSGNQQRYIEQVQALAGAGGAMMDQAAQAAGQNYAVSRDLTIGMASASLLLAVCLAVWICRGISVPLARAVGIAEVIASGDLSASIDAGGRDETGQLLQALRAMNGSLVHIVGAVRGSAKRLAIVAQEITNGARDLSARTQQQAGALRETAISMEKLTAVVQRNAGNARQASGIATSAALAARQGGVQVEQVVERMAALRTSSHRIRDIIGVIDGIAFQTNILALNAAVEAARAGAQGRGFAVVASEVRNLAQRSAGAAREIKLLIEASAEQISADTQFAADAGNTMREVVGQIERVSTIMGGIDSSNREQYGGIAEINQAIARIDQMTRQNAALVQQAAAARSMQDCTAALSAAVSVFVLERTRTGRHPGELRRLRLVDS